MAVIPNSRFIPRWMRYGSNAPLTIRQSSPVLSTLCRPVASLWLTMMGQRRGGSESLAYLSLSHSGVYVAVPFRCSASQQSRRCERTALMTLDTRTLLASSGSSTLASPPLDRPAIPCTIDGNTIGRWQTYATRSKS